jgi:hypothetical protein
VRRGTVRYGSHRLLRSAGQEAGGTEITGFAPTVTVPSPGVEAALACVVHVMLEPEDAEAIYVVVDKAYPPAVRSAVEEALAEALPGGIPVFVLSSEAGAATVECRGGDPAASAAAVVEVKRAAGWEESPMFAIAVNGLALEVDVSWDGTVSRVTVR